MLPLPQLLAGPVLVFHFPNLVQVCGVGLTTLAFALANTHGAKFFWDWEDAISWALSWALIWVLICGLSLSDRRSF